MQSQQLVNGNLMLANAGLTGLSGAASTFTTGKAVDYALGGKAFTRAAFAAAATPVVDSMGKAITVQPGTGVAVLWCLDAAGNVKLCAGGAEVVDATGAFVFAGPQFAAPSDDFVPFAYSVHKVLPGSAAFTIGVSLWNAAGSIHTATSIITLPGRPQIA